MRWRHTNQLSELSNLGHCKGTFTRGFDINGLLSALFTPITTLIPWKSGYLAVTYCLACSTYLIPLGGWIMHACMNQNQWWQPSTDFSPTPALVYQHVALGHSGRIKHIRNKSGKWSNTGDEVLKGWRSGFRRPLGTVEFKNTDLRSGWKPLTM